MTAFQMALLHFKRQKLQSVLIVLSLATALACSGLLLRVYNLSQTRYQNLPTEINAIMGPKSGGIEILLGALNMESKFHGVIPENLFQTLRAGADIHFEDRAIVSSKNITQAVIPITFIGTYDHSPIIATDGSFFGDLGNSPPPSDIWIGSQAAQKNNLKIDDIISVEIRGTLSKKTIRKNLRVGKILSPQNNTWDGSLFVNNQNTEAWLTETEAFHPVWKAKIVNYVLFKMNYQGFIPLQSLINDRTVSQLIWVDSEKQKLAELTDSAKEFGLIIVIVIFALAGFSIFGMMSLRSQSLRVSVATLEAIGYLPRFIYTWLVYEAALVGIFASAIAVVLELIAFDIVVSSLNSTWLIPLSQSSSLTWSILILVEGLIFSILGGLLASWQIVNLQIHSELKTG